jgi:hypothetical protein
MNDEANRVSFVEAADPLRRPLILVRPNNASRTLFPAVFLSPFLRQAPNLLEPSDPWWCSAMSVETRPAYDRLGQRRHLICETIVMRDKDLERRDPEARRMGFVALKDIAI